MASRKWRSCAAQTAVVAAAAEGTDYERQPATEMFCSSYGSATVDIMLCCLLDSGSRDRVRCVLF